MQQPEHVYLQRFIKESTILLMDMLEKAGLATMVGKVNMDRNSPDYLREETEESVNETISWLEEVQKKQYQHTKTDFDSLDLYRVVQMNLCIS